MTLVSDIIRDAYRESNLIAISTEPSGAQREEGLRLLNRLVASVYGWDESESFSPVYIGNNNFERPKGYPYYPAWNDSTWIVPPNTRLVLNLDDPQTVYLSPNPQDGQLFSILDNSGNLSTNALTVNANGHKIEGATSVVYNTDGLSKELMYRADAGNWQVISPLVETDLWPFPTEFDDMFIISLALRINPRNNVQLASESLLMLNRSRAQFRARYRQSLETNSELGLLMTRGTWPIRNGVSFDSQNSFNTGRPYRW